MRVGKWDENKILFKNRNRGGHDHFGGTRGAHIAAGALASAAVTGNKALGTGCIQVLNPRATSLGTNVAKRKLWYGVLAKTRLAATQMTYTMGGATGFTGIDWALVIPRYRRTPWLLQTGTALLYNYIGRATMRYLFLSASLGQGATASCFVEVWGY